MLDLGPLVVTLILWALGLAVLYWVIRLAVRHAIQDADERRSQPAYPATPPATRSPGARPTPPGGD
jgi:hypothetical protein